MQRLAALVRASLTTVLVLGCESRSPAGPKSEPDVPSLAKGGPGGGSGGTEFATQTPLPPVPGGQHGEAYAVDRAGSLIGGYSWDKAGRMHPVTWSLVNGSWQVTAFPWDAAATSAVVRGINDQREKAGTFWPASAPRAVIWNAAGNFTVLGCNELGEAYGISSGAQVVVGPSSSRTAGAAVVARRDQCRP